MSFLKQFFKNKTEIGAIAPSSKVLGSKMYGDLNFDSAKCIVEFGPGTGVFTIELLKKIATDAKLLVFETNNSFFLNLKNSIQDERLILINDSAEKIGFYIKQNGFDSADYIISSLPLTVFPSDLKDSILDESKKHLKSGGEYVQFQYSLNAYKLLKSKFNVVKLKFTVINIPPAFVYRCKV